MGIVSKLHEMIEEHMKEQPYEITCSECGKDLECDTEIDLDLDLKIKVTPCDCVTPDTV